MERIVADEDNNIYYYLPQHYERQMYYGALPWVSEIEDIIKDVKYDIDRITDLEQDRIVVKYYDWQDKEWEKECSKYEAIGMMRECISEYEHGLAVRVKNEQ